MNMQGIAFSNDFHCSDLEGLQELLSTHFCGVTLQVVDPPSESAPSAIVRLSAVDGYWPTQADNPDLLTGEFHTHLKDFLSDSGIAVLHSMAQFGDEPNFQSIAVTAKGQVSVMELAHLHTFHRTALWMVRE